MGFWNYFVGEAYCLYSACKEKEIKVCEVGDIKNPKKPKRIKWQAIKNISYINKKPFCKSPDRMTWKKISTCLSGKKQRRCPFLGFTLADREEFIVAVRAIEGVLRKKIPKGAEKVD